MTSIDEDDIQQQKEYVNTLTYLLNQREDELNVARHNYERALDRLNKEAYKLEYMKKELND